MRNLAAALTLLFILAGCASASMEVQSDIYKETPLAEKERQEDRLVDVAANIARMKAYAPTIAQARKELAGVAIEAYATYTAMVLADDPKRKAEAEVQAQAARKDFEDRRPKFVREVNKAVTDAEAAADDALVALGNYLAIVLAPTVDGEDQRKRLLSARAVYTDKASILKQKFELVATSGADTDFATGLGAVVRNLPVILKGRDSERANGLAENLSRASKSVDDLIASGVVVSSALPRNLEQATQDLRSGNVVGIQDTVPAALRGLLTLSAEGGRVISPRIQIRNIAAAQAFYISQIDRLQDPADPAWLEVLDPENEAKWVPFFARTKFKAEGNAEVIIVRDRPGHYRVQRGINNPAVLIQGQLEISRSIASGVTAILGAVSGVQVPVLGQPAQSGTATAVTSGPQSETLSQQEARVDAVQRLRASSRNSVVSELSLLTRELNALPANDTQRRDAIYARGSTILKSYSELLKFTGGI